MPRSAGWPAGPDRSLWDPQQSHVAEETGQTENSLPAITSRSQKSAIYRKQPDGRWLLARDANTLSPVSS